MTTVTGVMLFLLVFPFQVASQTCSDRTGIPGMTGTIQCSNGQCLTGSDAVSFNNNIACTDDNAATTLDSSSGEANDNSYLFHIGGSSSFPASYLMDEDIGALLRLIIGEQGSATVSSTQDFDGVTNIHIYSGGSLSVGASVQFKETDDLIVSGAGSSAVLNGVDRADILTPGAEWIVEDSGLIEFRSNSRSTVSEFHNHNTGTTGGLVVRDGGVFKVDTVTLQPKEADPAMAMRVSNGGILEVTNGIIQEHDANNVYELYVTNSSSRVICRDGSTIKVEVFDLEDATLEVTTGSCSLNSIGTPSLTLDNAVISLPDSGSSLRASGTNYHLTSCIITGVGTLDGDNFDLDDAGTRFQPGNTPGDIDTLTLSDFPRAGTSYIYDVDLDVAGSSGDLLEIQNSPDSNFDLTINFTPSDEVYRNVSVQVLQGHSNHDFNTVTLNCQAFCSTFHNASYEVTGDNDVTLHLLYFPEISLPDDDSADEDGEDETDGTLALFMSVGIASALCVSVAVVLSFRSRGSNDDMDKGESAAALLANRRAAEEDTKVLGAPDSKERLDAFNDLVMGAPEFCVVLGGVVPPTSREGAARAMIHVFESQRQAHTLISFLLTAHVTSVSESECLRTGVFTSSVITLYFRLVGESYMRKVVGPIVRDVVRQGNTKSELDPRRASSLTTLERGQDNISTSSQKLVDRITKIRLPPALQSILSLVKASLVKRGWSKRAGVVLPQLLLSRFLLPAVAQPQNYGLLTKAPSVNATRSLVLISKTVSSLVSNSTLGGKEEFMKTMKDFQNRNKKALSRFTNVLGNGPTPTPGQAGDTPAVTDLTLQRTALLALLNHAIEAGSELDTRLRGITAKQWAKLNQKDTKAWHRQTMMSVASLTSFISDDDNWSVGKDVDSLELDFLTNYSPRKGSPKKGDSPPKPRSSPLKKRKPSHSRSK